MLLFVNIRKRICESCNHKFNLNESNAIANNDEEKRRTNLIKLERENLTSSINRCTNDDEDDKMKNKKKNPFFGGKV